MVTVNNPSSYGGEQPDVDARSHALMVEFENHFRAVVALHPEAEGRRDHVFQAWAMQKIAGLQLVVEAIATKFNEHVGGSEHS